MLFNNPFLDYAMQLFTAANFKMNTSVVWAVKDENAYSFLMTGKRIPQKSIVEKYIPKRKFNFYIR